MKVATIVQYVGSEPIWAYEREEGLFLVRIREQSGDGSNNFIIQSPSGKLYGFYDYADTEGNAIKAIIDKKAESEEYCSTFDSIYDDNSI